MAETLANGVRHHVQRIGKGEKTVVFLHGLVMDNLSSWYFTVATRVAQSADVILYDLRGHGKSERPASGYRTDDLVADLLGLLDGLEVTRPVHLVGNSLGGLLALCFAAAHPDRVASLALVDAHVGLAGWGDRMAATLELEGDDRDRMIAESFKSWLGRHSQRKRTRLAQTAEALVSSTSLVEDMKSSPSLSDADFRRIACPVLALYGEHSDVRDAGERLARSLPHCELRIVAGSSHSVLWEATDHVRQEILTWVTAHARVAPASS